MASSSLFPNLYSSVDGFGWKGGHIRRNTLLNVKSKQIEIQPELNTAREQMMGVSCTEDPSKWLELLTKVTSIAVRLAFIDQKLAVLEHSHVAMNNGILPY